MFPPLRRRKKRKKKGSRKEESETTESPDERTNGARRGGLRRAAASEEDGPRRAAVRPVTSREVRLWLVEQLNREPGDMRDDALVVNYIAARTLRNYVPTRGPAAKHLVESAAVLRAEIQRRAGEGKLSQRLADAVNTLDGNDGEERPAAQQVPAAGYGETRSEQAPAEPAPAEPAPAQASAPAPPAQGTVIDTEATEQQQQQADPPTTVVTPAPKDDAGDG